MVTSDTKPGKARKGKPITENPLFPAVVALWFGALFGLGSLAIRVGLIEQVVLASRIDTLVSAAAPPLGVTTRIFLALVLAVIGAALGAWIARKIAAPKPVQRERKRGAAPAQDDAPVEVRARDSHPDAPARRPISAHEELGGDGPVGVHADAGALAGRRRSALAIEHDETFELHENAPLPGGAWQIRAADAAAEDALDLGTFADAAAEHGSIGGFDPLPPAPGPALDWQANSVASTDRQLFQPLPSAEAVAAPDQVKGAAAPLAFAPPADAREGRQVFGMAQPQPDEVLDQLGITDAEFEELAPLSPPVEEVQADNAKLGIEALAAKLASSMQRRREAAAARAAAAAATAAAVVTAAAPPIPTAYEPPVASEAVDARIGDPVEPAPGFLHPNDIPAPVLSDLPSPPMQSLPPVFAAPVAPEPVAKLNDTVEAAPNSIMSTRVPAALRPIALGAEPDDEYDLASLLPPRSIAMPAPAPTVAVEDEAVEEPSDESRFSSLLDVAQSPAPRQDFVRIEEPSDTSLAIEPVVIFPGQAARMAAPSAPAAASFDSAAEPSSFRRFDAPGSAEAGQQIAANVAPAQDAAETERALRAALANLQRMSGAA